VIPPASLAVDDRAARRQLLLDVTGIAVSIAAFGIVYGIAARDTGLSLIETISMSALPFAGASQFAALGYLDQGLSWAVVIGMTALLNARHLLYSASLAPHLVDVPLAQRATMAQVLTDVAFANPTNHFKRLGRPDVVGYWIAAVAGVYLPWNLGTAVGAVAGGFIPDPSLLGLDVVFPASMAGLAVGLVTGRRELIATAAAVAIGLAVALAAGPRSPPATMPRPGPAVALAVPRPSSEAAAR
jgi:predicted branched-subunit amino acid permease